MKLNLLFILFLLGVLSWAEVGAQTEKKALAGNSLFINKKDTLSTKSDSIAISSDTKKDSVPKHIPRIATRRSAIIPGWGQAYNKEYWKIPIVYGILAIPITLYFYNDSYYKKTKFAFEARFKEANGDPSDVAAIDPQLTNLGLISLQNYRNSFRKDRDYSILWFLLAWGLQVADATVFAHLKQFDVNNDLSMNLKPQFNPQTQRTGISLTVNLKSNAHKMVITR